jgi:peptidoglycan/LPS O-acetylase OafA/YrhL/SAM-dependent methyltransferase
LVTADAQTIVAQEASAGGRVRSVRVANLDVLRAVAAFSVLCIHSYALGGRVVPIKAQYWYDVPLAGLAGGVWLFFAISGYVISKPFVDRLVAQRPRPAVGAYALRRITRIYPLYLIALTAVIAIDGTGGVGPWNLAGHYLLINNLIPGQQETVFSTAWTLTLEVIFYATVPLLALALARSRLRITPELLAWLVLGSWIASIAFCAIADLQGDGEIGLWLRGSFPAMWQAFCPGILLAIAPHLQAPGWRRWVTELPGRRLALAVSAVAVAAGMVVSALAPLRFGIAPYQLVYDSTRVMFAIGFSLLVAAALRSPAWSDRRRFILELGLASYGIYLIHPVVEAFLLRHGISPIPHDTAVAYAVNTAFLVALTVPLALASWRWLEQPSIELGRRLGKRLKARPAAASSGASTVDPDEIRRFWNERAREDAFYFVDTRQPYRSPDPEQFWASEEIVDQLLAGLGVTLLPTDTVLEIGCGLGRLTRVLAARATTVVALDVSDEMLDRARALNPELDNVRWVLGDGVSLAGIADDSVDGAVSTVVFQHVPDQSITLQYVRELGRVLRSGAWAALQISNDPAIHRPRDGLPARCRALVRRGPRGQRHPAWLGSHVELDALEAAAHEAGLLVERIWGAGSQYCQVLLRRNRT